MPTKFEDNALSCVMEYLYLFRNGNPTEKRTWCEVNGIQLNKWGTDGNDPFLGSGATVRQLEYALNLGRPGEVTPIVKTRNGLF